ncbi:IS21-like element helper ATPase IstB [Aquimarina macrocephali]|uniref:IS21-like element helper ATPase IstB n=1 Tax=Aquimarina macrocephali TaxID=666563 RepID=UPI00046674A4|nr:IS21-like element helper ATPase IstB [Aquimarina macrocephali]
MNSITLQKLKHLRFYGMHDAFKSIIETGKLDNYSLDQLVSHLIESEWDDRQNRRIERTIKYARFKYKAQIENIVFSDQRELNRDQIHRLTEFEFIKKSENILITGSTGVGKSYLATAIGHQACIEGYRVFYFNTNKMLAKLKMAKADGSYLKEMSRIEKHPLIILDDFGLQVLDKQNRMTLLEIIEDRHEKGAIILTSQLPVNQWYEVIGEKTVADAIMDRLVHNAHRLELKGESMRRKRNK